MKINIRRGFRRIYSVLWVGWALYVFVGVPLIQANENQGLVVQSWNSAIKSLDDEYDRSPTSDRAAYLISEAKIEKEQLAKLSEANLPFLYRNSVFPNFHWFLLAAILPPILFYGLLMASLRFLKWLGDGFNAERPN